MKENILFLICIIENSLYICAMFNSQINKKNMVKATNVSQKAREFACGTFRPEEIRLKQIVEKVKLTADLDLADWLLIRKELGLSLRVIYGVYLAMCAEEGISKVITWRTFYMQCNGYRKLKPNTIRAIVKFITCHAHV